jgi:hypothetical protein
MEDNELVSITFHGIAPSWKPFVQNICACDNFPDFAKFWDYLMEEEIILESCSNK